jgi:hypothetical protein
MLGRLPAQIPPERRTLFYLASVGLRATHRQLGQPSLSVTRAF